MSRLDFHPDYLVPAPEKIFSAPDFRSVFLKLDIFGALKLSLLPAIISILFTDLFDSISTFHRRLTRVRDGG